MRTPWLIGLALLGAAGCGGPKPTDEGGDDGGFYGDEGGEEGGEEGGDGAADGAADGGGGADEGGGSGGAEGGGSDVSSDDGWDGGGTGTGDGGDGVSPTPDWAVDSSVACEGGLSFQLHVIDPSGVCTECAAGPIWLGAAIYNPCEEPLEVSLDGGMVITGGLAESESGSGMGWSSGSDGSVESIVLAPGEAVTGTEHLGDLSSGPWRFVITFGDRDRRSVETARTLR